MCSSIFIGAAWGIAAWKCIDASADHERAGRNAV
jgi:hypothetical protein